MGSSFVIVRRSDQSVLFETVSRKLVEALNTEKYEAVPILKYLSSLNDAIAKKEGRK